MDTYSINITQFAENQLRDIKNYIVNELHAPEHANHFLDLLENEINTLSQLPQRIALVDEEPWHSEGIHKMVIKNFILYFWIDEVKMIVQVIAVVYKKRNQVKQLLKMNLK